VPPNWQSQPQAEPPDAAADSSSPGIRTLQIAGQGEGQVTGSLRPGSLLGLRPSEEKRSRLGTTKRTARCPNEHCQRAGESQERQCRWAACANRAATVTSVACQVRKRTRNPRFRNSRGHPGQGTLPAPSVLEGRAVSGAASCVPCRRGDLPLDSRATL
jgi:hypothetical protein